MKRSLIVKILVPVFSAGWLLPLAFGVDTYLGFWDAEILPLLLSQPRPINSFPSISVAADSFKIAFAWLAAVILFWSYQASALWCTPANQH